MLSIAISSSSPHRASGRWRRRCAAPPSSSSPVTRSGRNPPANGAFRSRMPWGGAGSLMRRFAQPRSRTVHGGRRSSPSEMAPPGMQSRRSSRRSPRRSPECRMTSVDANILLHAFCSTPSAGRLRSMSPSGASSREHPGARTSRSRNSYWSSSTRCCATRRSSNGHSTPTPPFPSSRRTEGIPAGACRGSPRPASRSTGVSGPWPPRRSSDAAASTTRAWLSTCEPTGSRCSRRRT